MFIGGILGQCLAHRVRSQAIPLPRIDVLAVRSAYGGGLHIDEQFVKFFYRYIKYSPCRAKAHKGYKIHHLVAGQHTRALQNSESSVYFVLHRDIGAHTLRRRALLGDELAGYRLEVLYRRLLGYAEGYLIAQLIDIAARLPALAVCAAKGQTELGYGRAEDCELAASSERGQMQHDGRAHGCAEIRRALSQIAETLVKREIQLLIERGVNFICKDIAVHERETRFHDLDADMILLTEHDADRLIFSEHERPALADRGELGAYQMALGERYRLLTAERIHCDIVEPQLGHA